MSAPEQVLAELNRRLDPAGRRNEELPYLNLLPRVQCADGFSVSVQACAANYCSPRDNEGPWDSVELGFPSERVEAFMRFAEDGDRPTETVYGWVPLELVAEVIAAHGGLAQVEAA